MPTVPSTFAPFSLDDGAFIASSPLPGSEMHDVGGPTPDPDFDDVVLVPTDQGDAVTTDHDLHLPPPSAHIDILIKPHISLDTLALHSPSSIVGTPFDVSPRFEYPFPPSVSEPDATSYPVSPFFPVSFPATAPPPASTGLGVRSNASGYFPVHPKLRPRDPPIPPSLAKKRRIVYQAHHTRSHSGNEPVGETNTFRPRTELAPRRATLERLPSEETASSGSSDTDVEVCDGPVPTKMEQAQQVVSIALPPVAITHGELSREDRTLARLSEVSTILARQLPSAPLDENEAIHPDTISKKSLNQHQCPSTHKPSHEHIHTVLLSL